MQSSIQPEYEVTIHLYDWVLELNTSDRIVLDEETKLELRKACLKLASYPYELQIALAKLYKKYYLQLEAPKWAGMNLDKACELDWLKVSLLQTPEGFKNQLSPFILQAYKQLAEEDVLVPNSMIWELAKSNQYFLQKYAVLFLKKSLFENGNDFEQAREVIATLFKSEFDTIVIGAIKVLGDFPALFPRFPERLFWMVSERDDMILISLLRILWKWGDHSLIDRVLDGGSWSEYVKREVIKAIAFFPSEKYLEQLMHLLKTYPDTVGVEVVQTLKSLKMAGVLLRQKDLQHILSFYLKYGVLEPQDAAFLIQNVTERTLVDFYSRYRNKVSMHKMVALLSELKGFASTPMLVKMYADADLNWEKNLLLDAFINKGAAEFEAPILKRFEENPMRSIEALTYLGGKATAIYLREKLKQNESKVNLYAWEEKAVKLIFQIEGFDTELLAVLARWNVPYLSSVASEARPLIDKGLYPLFEEEPRFNSKEDAQNLQSMVVSLGDPQGVPFLVKCLYHEVESVRDAATDNLDKFLSKLYDQKRLTPRSLLKSSCVNAVRAGRSRLIIDELLHNELDSVQQDLLLDVLLLDLDTAVLKEHYYALTERGNVHFEKRLIEAIGLAESIDLAPLLNRYLDKKQDIFRLRQAIISAEKLGAHHLSNFIEPFLMHQNMNIRKAAASFVSKIGGIRSVPILIELLKNQDNPGLRDVVEAGLIRILNQRYQAYILNELKACESESQISLLQEALKRHLRIPSEKSFELSRLPEFKALTEPNTKNLPKAKPIARNINWVQLNEVVYCLSDLVLNNNMDRKSFLEDSMKSLQVSEKSVIFHQIRKYLKDGKKHQKFLIELVLKNDGVLSEATAVLAMATNSKSMMNETHQTTLLSKVDFSSIPTEMYPELFRFYNTSHRSTLCNWVERQRIDLWSITRNEYEDWEFMELFKDYSGLVELNIRVSEMLEEVGPHRGEFISLVLLNTSSNAQIELMSCLLEEELHTHYEFILSTYLKMEERSKAAFLKAIGNGPTKLRLKRDAQLHKEVNFEEADLEAMTPDDLKSIETRLTSLLKEDNDQLVKNAKLIKSCFFLLKNEERVAAKVFYQLFDKPVFWDRTFKEIREQIFRLDEEAIWRICEPVLEKGDFRCLGYLSNHRGYNRKVLGLLQSNKEVGKMELLKWLDKISNTKFYFPTLFEELIKSRPDDPFFERALNLIFKLEAFDKGLDERAYFHIQGLMQTGDEASQLAIFTAMERCASTQFLREEGRREFILEHSRNELTKERAFMCVLRSVNWYYGPDLNYVLDTLKKPFACANTIYIERALLQLERLNANEQIRVYAMFLQIEAFQSQVHKSVLDLFKADYQIIDALGEEQRTRFLEECKAQVAKGNWAEDFAVAICKNLGMAQVEGYIQLATELLLEHKSRKVRSLCLRELKKGATREQYLDACEAVLRKGDKALQSQVIKALSFAKRPRIVPLLIPLLFDKNSSTRKLSKNGILHIGPSGLKHLEHEIGKTRPDKRETIQQLIEEMGNIK